MPQLLPEPNDNCTTTSSASPRSELEANPQGFEPMRQSITAAKPPHAAPGQGYASTSEQGAFPVHYEHLDGRLGIHFQVSKLPFEQLQAMDARLLTIAPGATNEKHRHAHESIFVVLQGEALMDIGGEDLCLVQGDVAYVPRWAVHQTRNRSQETVLLMLAITDFGLTSALIGNYDRSTRLKTGGEQAFS